MRRGSFPLFPSADRKTPFLTREHRRKFKSEVSLVVLPRVTADICLNNLTYTSLLSILADRTVSGALREGF